MQPCGASRVRQGSAKQADSNSTSTRRRHKCLQARQQGLKEGRRIKPLLTRVTWPRVVQSVKRCVRGFRRSHLDWPIFLAYVHVPNFQERLMQCRPPVEGSFQLLHCCEEKFLLLLSPTFSRPATFSLSFSTPICAQNSFNFSCISIYSSYPIDWYSA